ncbi:MAG: hypothetical protein LBP19_00440 [Treponema sp.]|jgi:hypothetical protein|nr:hypothetical protein [Treponema sp.]
MKAVLMFKVIKKQLSNGRLRRAKTKLKQNYEQGAQGDLFEKEPARSYSGDFRSPECIALSSLFIFVPH